MYEAFMQILRHLIPLKIQIYLNLMSQNQALKLTQNLTFSGYRISASLIRTLYNLERHILFSHLCLNEDCWPPDAF